MATPNIKFQIKGIEISDITLNYPGKLLPKETKYNFEINLRHKIVGEENLIIVAPIINIIYDEDKEIHGSIRTSLIFQIENLEQFKKSDSDEYDIQESFITTLNSIALSTTRGIMFSQFKGTFLHHAILPTVNPRDFSKEI